MLNTTVKDQELFKICSLKFHSNDEGILQYVFWQTQQVKDIFRSYCKLISVDSTFNLNRSSYALNILVTIDANNQIRICAFGSVANDKRTDIITDFFEWFNSEYLNYPNIRTIVTDKNESQINVLRTIYPFADITLCLFHVFKSMKLETRKKLPSYVLEEMRGI